MRPPLRSARAVSVVVNDVFPLGRVGASHYRDDGFAVAHVEDLVRNAWLYEDKIAGSIVDSSLRVKGEG